MQTNLISHMQLPLHMENEYESYFALKNKFDLVKQAYKSYFAVKKIENLCIKISSLIFVYNYK